jgi:uncharacterized Zn finger protein (UPF0148 family)
MKAIACKMCGSTNVVITNGMVICKACGTKHVINETNTETTTIDTENLYILARRARKNKDWNNMSTYYNALLVIDPNNWETYFYTEYCKAISADPEDISKAAKRLYNINVDVIQLLKLGEPTEEEEAKAIDDMYHDLMDLAHKYHDDCEEYFHNGFNTEEKFNRLRGTACGGNMQAALILYNFGDLLVSEFGDKYGTTAANMWDEAITIQNSYLQYSLEAKDEIEFMERYVWKIQKVFPNYEEPEFKKSFCYVATSIYGSYDCPEVWTLRRFRDNTLDNTWYGRLFIKAYYGCSPWFVKHYGGSKAFRSMLSLPIAKLVSSLQKKGVESTPYIDKY